MAPKSPTRSKPTEVSLRRLFMKAFWPIPVVVLVYVVLRVPEDGVDALKSPDFIGALTFGLMASIIYLYLQFTGITLYNEAKELSDALLEDPSKRIMRYIPIHPWALDIVRFITLLLALVLLGYVVFHIDFLILYAFVLKQRAYSHLYVEIGTPVAGPVFITQFKQLTFLLVDGFLAPLAWLAGLVGYNIGRF